MPNHWHLVFNPRAGDVLQRLLHWLTVTHTQRHRAAHGTIGDGHLYQGRYRSFPIATDDHLLTVLRYVERNPLRASLVAASADWPWSSAARRCESAGTALPRLAPWPISRPRQWLAYLDQPLTAAEELDDLERLRHATRRGTPFGPAGWVQATAKRLDLASTLRPPGRPRRENET